MSTTRKTAACILALLSMTVSAFAAAPKVIPLEPNEVIKEQSGELKTVKKVYVLPKTENADKIAKDKFSENGVEYEFTELLKEDNSRDDVKEHTETISIHTSSSNTQTVISKFEPISCYTIFCVLHKNFSFCIDTNYKFVLKLHK